MKFEIFWTTLGLFFLFRMGDKYFLAEMVDKSERLFKDYLHQYNNIILSTEKIQRGELWLITQIKVLVGTICPMDIR